MLNIGTLASRLALFTLSGSGHSLENNGTLESTEGGAFVVAGNGFSLENNVGTIKAGGTIVSVIGDDADIRNNAEMISSGGGRHSYRGGGLEYPEQQNHRRSVGCDRGCRRWCRHHQQ
ncbi:MAG: hypothetical protein KL863_00725 [Rhizobium sp.]|nr:hypothetical protein [Rhizobium sp.]